MRNKQYLAAIRPLDGALAMSTMRFADEVVDRKDIEELPGGGAKAAPKELKMAAQLIDSLTTDWDPSRYSDTYTEQLRGLIEAKAAGREVTAAASEVAPSKVLDLMAALEASLSAARSKGAKKDLPAALQRAAEELSGDDEDGRDDDGGPDERASTKQAPTRQASTKKPTAKKPAAAKAANKKPTANKGAARKSA